MAVSSISSSSSLKDIQNNTINNKKNSSDKTESTTTSKYDKYVKGEGSEDSGIYSSNSKKSDTEDDGYHYRTRQEKRELKAKKSRAFSFGGLFSISAESVFERLNSKNTQ